MNIKSYRRTWTLLFLSFVIMMTSGAACVVGHSIDTSIYQYDSAKNQISLGDSKENVLAILEPTQEGLSPNWKKFPEQYISNGIKVEIYYFRSGRVPDGVVTDDEFTPYVFHDGKLASIGWSALGGPKTRGQPRQRIRIDQDVNVGSNWDQLDDISDRLDDLKRQQDEWSPNRSRNINELTKSYHRKRDEEDRERRLRRLEQQQRRNRDLDFLR